MNNELKKLIIKGMLFVTLLLLLFAFTNTHFMNTNNQKEHIHHKENLFNSFIAKNSSIDYLFIGDSHTVSGIVASEIKSNSFNYGVPSESFTDTYFRLRDTLKKNITIKAIVLEVDYSMGHIDIYPAKMHFYKKYILLSDLMKSNKSDKASIIAKYYIPFAGEINTYYMNPRGNIFDRHGTKTREHPPKKISLTEIPNRPYSNTDYLDEIIELCEKKNIDLIFLMYPLYYKNTENHIYYENMYEKLNGTYLLDYTNLFINNSELFTDNKHLSLDGAQKLTAVLNGDLH